MSNAPTQESIELQLTTKLQSAWSAEKIASQLNTETLEALILPSSSSTTSDEESAAVRFSALDTTVKTRLLLSSLSLRKNQQQAFKQPLKNIMKYAAEDGDDWVRVISAILSSYPAFASSQPTEQDVDAIAPVDHPTYRETVEAFEKRFKIDSVDNGNNDAYAAGNGSDATVVNEETATAAMALSGSDEALKKTSPITPTSPIDTHRSRCGLRSLTDMYMTSRSKHTINVGGDNKMESAKRPKHLKHHSQQQKMEISLQANEHFKLRQNARDDLIEPMRFLDKKIQEHRERTSDVSSSAAAASPTSLPPRDTASQLFGRSRRQPPPSSPRSTPGSMPRNRPSGASIGRRLSREKQNIRSVNLIDTDEMQEIMKQQEEARTQRQKKMQEESEAEKERKRREKEEAKQRREQDRQDRKRQREEDKLRKAEENANRKKQRAAERQQLMEQQQAMADFSQRQQQWLQQHQQQLSRLTPEQRELFQRSAMLQHQQQQQQQQHQQQHQQQQQQGGGDSQLSPLTMPSNPFLGMFSAHSQAHSQTQPKQQQQQLLQRLQQQTHANSSKNPNASGSSNNMMATSGQFNLQSFLNPHQIFANPSKPSSSQGAGITPFGTGVTTMPGGSSMLSLLGMNTGGENSPFAKPARAPQLQINPQAEQDAARILQGANCATEETRSRIVNFLSGIGQGSASNELEELLIHKEVDPTTNQMYHIKFQMNHKDAKWKKVKYPAPREAVNE